MKHLRFTADHEWIGIDDNGVATVGITDFAQSQLGDLVFVQLPNVGQQIDQGEEAAVIESVKAAGEVKMPVAGTVVEVNATLTDQPATINQDPQGAGWIFKLTPTDSNQFSALMDSAGYSKFVNETS